MRRKDFLRMSGLLGIGGALSSFSKPQTPPTPSEELNSKIRTAGLTGGAFDLKSAPLEKVRIALFGLGNRGQSLIEMLNWLVQEGHAEITAISDINPRQSAQGSGSNWGIPIGYSGHFYRVGRCLARGDASGRSRFKR